MTRKTEKRVLAATLARKTFHIEGLTFRVGQRICLIWTNRNPRIIEKGVISDYDPKRGKSCLRLNGEGPWYNPRHPSVYICHDIPESAQ